MRSVGCECCVQMLIIKPHIQRDVRIINIVSRCSILIGCDDAIPTERYKEIAQHLSDEATADVMLLLDDAFEKMLFRTIGHIMRIEQTAFPSSNVLVCET